MIDIANDNLIGISEVARQLKVKTQTVRNWVNSGKLYAVQVGCRWYTNEQCLNAMAQSPPKQQQVAPKRTVLQQALADRDRQNFQDINALLGQTG